MIWLTFDECIVIDIEKRINILMLKKQKQVEKWGEKVRGRVVEKSPTLFRGSWVPDSQDPPHHAHTSNKIKISFGLIGNLPSYSLMGL